MGKEKSFEYANSAIKLIIGLSTGVLTFTITFIKDIIGDNCVNAFWCLETAWFILVSSIFFGLWTMLAITGSIDRLEEDPNSNININSANVRIPSTLSIISFLLGIIFFVIFIVNNLWVK